MTGWGCWARGHRGVPAARPSIPPSISLRTNGRAAPFENLRTGAGRRDGLLLPDWVPHTIVAGPCAGAFSMALFVQKYGGTSVADAERIVNVARRIADTRSRGSQVVAVVSAMGDTTDELIDLAHTVSPDPDPRELDLLLSTGELVSCTLMTMALRTLGCEAVSLSGSQAGIHTDTMHGKARIHSIDTARIRNRHGPRSSRRCPGRPPGTRPQRPAGPAPARPGYGLCRCCGCGRCRAWCRYESRPASR